MENSDSTSIGPIIVESQVPWITVEGCSSPDNECIVRGLWKKTNKSKGG
jgi:hypothetical protein